MKSEHLQAPHWCIFPVVGVWRHKIMEWGEPFARQEFSLEVEADGDGRAMQSLPNRWEEAGSRYVVIFDVAVIQKCEVIL
jgi:hypothetical protein